jgi:hypothetical protein
MSYRTLVCDFCDAEIERDANGNRNGNGARLLPPHDDRYRSLPGTLDLCPSCFDRVIALRPTAAEVRQ